MWLLYVVAVIESSVSRVAFGGAGTLIPTLVDRADLAAANALSILVVNSTRILGPPIGGVLLAHDGAASRLVLDAATYFVSGLLLFLMSASVSHGARPT